MNFESELFTQQIVLSHHFASLTKLLYREKRVIFVLLLSILFFFGAVFSDRLESSLFLCVYVCVRA